MLSYEYQYRENPDMPMIIEERSMWNRPKGSAFGVTVNTKGVMGAGVAKYIRDNHPIVYTQYKEACKNGKLLEQGYLEVMDLFQTFVCVITKHDWKNDSKYEYIIDSLLKLDARMLMSKEGMLGHGIEEINLPPVGCGNGNLIWEEVEDKLKEDLKDTQMNFIFCVESWRRPDRFAETDLDGWYFFKGDSVLGLTGNYPFKIGDVTYDNAEEYILVEVSRNVKPYNSCEESIRKYVSNYGLIFPNGMSYSDAVAEACYTAKKAQYEQLPALKEQLDKLQDKPIAYCGRQFTYVLGTGFQLSDVDDVGTDTRGWQGNNILGEILKSL